ncbi:MAG TPA: AMP-binding protein, partial [Bryobacteraceae bacterium]
MLGTMMDYPLTIAPILERTERLFGPVEIVSRLPDKSIRRSNYREVCSRARALAAALAAAGVQRSDRVATLMWNHVWHLDAYFGVPASGAVLHTLNLRLHPDELSYIVNHAGDRVLLVDDVLL